MSGDVQPRKRKDKKRKKDELGIEEPRGTAAALGEGDVFMHSYQDHGTGGHWCAKVIFFALLAVLITLIGLIILENRGLSELEANAVESRYSGVLEGWLEDAPDDDHHDVHTLDLKHHDDDEDDHAVNHNDDEHGDEDEEHEDEDDEGHEDEEDEEHEDEGHDDEEDEGDEDEEDDGHEDEDEPADEDEDDEGREDDDDEQEETREQDLEEDNEDEDDRRPYRYYADDDDDDEEGKEDEDDNENEQEIEEDEQDEQEHDNESNELENDDRNNDDNDEDQNDSREDEEEHDDHEEEEEDEEVEVEKIEQEASEEEPISTDLPALPEDDDDDDDKEDADNDDNDENDTQEDDVDDADDAGDDDDETDDADDDFLEADDGPVERITAPAGKPFVEVEEDETSSERPPDTLEEEEEYEKQQEELRKEQEQTSHIWLKLSVGVALLAATHALVRRAAAPSDEAEDEHETREETPVVDRRMTLIPEEPVVPKKVTQESAKPIVEEIVKKVPELLKSAPVVKQDSEEEEIEEPEEIEEEEIAEIEAPKVVAKQEKDEELYSDEEEADDEEEKVEEKKETKQVTVPEPEDDDDVPDDVEIIDDEQLEEELEEEEDEVSDVDDTELLSRLEAKYGRLPEPHRAWEKPKDGGNSLEDDWPGEPSDAFWRQQLDSAEDQLRQGAWTAAAERASAAELRGSARARFVVATALDRGAEAARDNALLTRAIAAYLELLKMNEHLSDKKLVEITQRTLNRIQFRGNYLSAEPVYRLLIRRFPKEPAYRNNLTISFLMANRVDLAEEVLKETITQWPNDRVALAHYGFVLKTSKNKLEEAIEAFERALDGDKGPACEPRFYYHYGDALLLLGRYKEAHEVHKRGAKYGHFLSPSQRSLYNVPRLKSRPWWNAFETPYAKLAKSLEKSWKDILKEGEAAKALFEKEKEGLKERGDWSQMDLFVRGQEIPGRCNRAPVTCSIVKAEVLAAGCRRGQVKFSAMEAGTHVRPHVGPTNCRLRMHLGLSNTKDTYLRVDLETRQWQEGKVLLFDDSFEHEVWHNGTGKRLVLIVDVWHPGLTPQERRTLPAI